MVKLWLLVHITNASFIKNLKRGIIMKSDIIERYNQLVQPYVQQQEKIPLINFWRKAEFYPGTFILKDEYPILKENNLLISENEIATNTGLNKIHPKLQHEPVVGDLVSGNFFIINLNPRAGVPYAQEYKNWANPELSKIALKTAQQKDAQNPFYYLTPEGLKTDGGKWWTARLGIKNFIEKFTPNQNIIIDGKSYPFEFIFGVLKAQFCDIEICPYHSNKWNSKLENLILDGNLKSSTMAIEFVRTIIADPEKNIFIRGFEDTSTVAKTLRKFIPELKSELPNVHYIPCQQTPYLTPKSVAGKKLYSCIAKWADKIN